MSGIKTLIISSFPTVLELGAALQLSEGLSREMSTVKSKALIKFDAKIARSSLYLDSLFLVQVLNGSQGTWTPVVEIHGSNTTIVL